jgi:rubrerythrin
VHACGAWRVYKIEERRFGRRDRQFLELFRDTAEGETGHAAGHVDWLKSIGDPETGLPIGTTIENLQAAIAGETREHKELYPRMAEIAREEGFSEIAEWFETLARAEQHHAARFTQGLKSIKS